MRLKCPKCGAIYEIDADLIPASGRDVQCASCAHVWIQTRRAPDPPAEGEGDADGGLAEETPAPPVEEGRTAAAPGAPAAGEDAPDAETAEDEAEAAGPGAEDAAPEHVGDTDTATDIPTEDGEAVAPRRRPDDDTLRILREEAALAAARRKGREAAGDSPPPTAQPETPPPAPAATRQTSPVLSRPDRDEAGRPSTADPELDRAAEPDSEDARETPGNGRRAASEESGDLLPDLDEINSSLSGPARRSAPTARPTPHSRRRWPSGAAAVLGLIVLLIAIYLAAPWIAGQVPALEGPLGAYAGAIDTLRGWIGAAPGA